MDYEEWREALFNEIECDEDIFVSAGEDYIENMWYSYMDYRDAADELIEEFGS